MGNGVRTALHAHEQKGNYIPKLVAPQYSNTTVLWCSNTGRPIVRVQIYHHNIPQQTKALCTVSCQFLLPAYQIWWFALLWDIFVYCVLLSHTCRNPRYQDDLQWLKQGLISFWSNVSLITRWRKTGLMLSLADFL